MTLDVEVYLGAEKHSTLLGSLRFFNANNIQFGNFPDGMACLIKASVGSLSPLFTPGLIISPQRQFVQSLTDSTIYGISPKEHQYIGDVHSVSGLLPHATRLIPALRISQIVPLGPAPDPENVFNPMVCPNVFLSGVALDRNTDTSSFTLDIDVWISASKNSTKPSFKPTAHFQCVIPDSPRYKASGKPIPYNHRFVSVSGTLTNVTYKDPTAQDLEIKRFVVTVEEIVFLGQQANSSPTPAKQIPNTLDGKLTPHFEPTLIYYHYRCHPSDTPGFFFLQRRQLLSEVPGG